MRRTNAPGRLEGDVKSDRAVFQIIARHILIRVATFHGAIVVQEATMYKVGTVVEVFGAAPVLMTTDVVMPVLPA